MYTKIEVCIEICKSIEYKRKGCKCIQIIVSQCEYNMVKVCTENNVVKIAY